MADIDRLLYDGAEYAFTDKVVRDALFFKPGETCTLNKISCGGYITSSQKSIFFTITVPKYTNFVSTMTVTSFRLNIRHVGGGYVEQSASVSGGYEYIGKSDYKVSFSRIGMNTYQMRLDKTSGALLNVPANNTPVGIEGYIKLQFN